jgi:hypothetical protein
LSPKEGAKGSGFGTVPSPGLGYTNGLKMTCQIHI